MRRAPQWLSREQTEAFLLRYFGQGVAAVRPLAAGAWSQAYAFRHGGSDWVIRWSDLPDNFARDAFAARFARPGLPIPPLSAFDREGDLYFAVAPLMPGAYYEDFPPGELARTVPAILAMLRALRRVELSATTGAGVWDGSGNGLYPGWRDFLLSDSDRAPGSLIQGWRARLRTSAEAQRLYDELWARFEPLVARCPEERRLIHADLLNSNVLAEPGRVTAVLDWGSSLYGDPLWDVARFSFYEPWYPHFREVGLIERLLADFRADPAANTEDLDARLRCYHLAIALDSIAYNASREHWQNAREAGERALRLLDA